MEIAILVLVLLATLVVSLALSSDEREADAPLSKEILPLYAVALATLGAAFLPSLQAWSGKPLLIGAAAGLIGYAVFCVFPKSPGIGWIVGWGCALIASGLIKSPMLAEYRWMQMAVLGGGGLGYLLFARPAGSSYLLGLLATVGLSIFTREATLATPDAVAFTIPAVLFFAAFGSIFIQKVAPNKSKFLSALGSWVITLAIATALAPRFIGALPIWKPVLLAAIAAIATAWFVSEEEGDSYLLSLASGLIWLGLCTVASGLDRALGIPILVGVGIATFLVLGRRRALLSITPVIGLLFFRLLRLIDPSAMKTLELGQNYALVGIVAGLFFAALAYESVRVHRGLISGLLGASLIILVAACLILMGGKGSVGLMIGASLAGAYLISRAANSLEPVAASLAIAGVAGLLHSWLVPMSEMAKADKTQLLMKLFIAAAVPGAVVLFLLNKRSAPATEVAA